MMITNAELIFWCAACAIAVFVALVGIPMLSNYIAYRDNEKMFAER